MAENPRSPGKTGSLLERIAGLGKITRSETKVIDFIQKVYPSVAFETPTSIGQKAGVSKATVTRFISRLGYDGFNDFQERLRAELMQRLDTPLDRLRLIEARDRRKPVDHLDEGINSVIRDLHETHARNRPQSVRRAAAFLSRAEGKLFVLGLHSSFGLAHYFWSRAAYIREQVILVDCLADAAPQKLLDCGSRDVMLLVMHRGYAHKAQLAADFFLGTGGRLVLLTDREDAPLSHRAEITLVAPTFGQGMFESRAGSLALLQVLLEAMVNLDNQKALARYQKAERAFEDLEIFSARPRSRSGGKDK